MKLVDAFFNWVGKNAPAAIEMPMREAYGVTIDDDEDSWRPLTGDSKRDLAPITQDRMREMAVYLWESNLLANRLIELPLAYLLAEGVELSSDDEAVQEVLETFWEDPINQMDMKLAKKCRELALYGEQCYPTFVNEITGHVRLGYLDPGLIATVVADPDNAEQPIGIVTKKDKKGNAKRYRVIINGAEEVFTKRTQAIRETFNDGECFFFKVNDLSNGMRGRSDLLAQADWIDGYDQFLFGELDRVQFMRAFMWDVTITGADEEEIKKRAREISPPAPNSVRVHNENETWKAETPSLQSGDTTNSARLFRNHVLGGATMPEHWFGGGGDVNRAVGAEMHEPTMKTFAMRQKQIIHILKMMGVYVVRQYLIAEENKEPEPKDPRLKVKVEFPEMTPRDITKYASSLQQVVTAVNIAVDKNLIQKSTAISIIKTIADRLGVEMDAEEELKKANDAAASKAESDVFVAPDLSKTPKQNSTQGA